MKVIVIGDIHGRDYWKSFIDKMDSIDRVVFLGDYCDSYCIHPSKVISNLNKIIEFKKKYMDKVILLLGNHDLQYYFLDDPAIKCSGFRKKFSNEYFNLLKSNSSLFKLAHTVDIKGNTYLFSHAGINSIWLEKVFPILSNIKNNNTSSFQEGSIFNVLLLEEYKYYLWDISHYRKGKSDYGSMVWMDMREYNDISISIDKFKSLFDISDGNKIVQIVGHNRVTYPTTVNKKVYYFDSQDTEPVFGIISENGVKALNIKSLKHEVSLGKS